MDDGDALLRAILAQPEEDTPRLAFADWLEEQGSDWVKCERCGGSGKSNGLRLKRNGNWSGACQNCGGRGEVDLNAHCGERAELIRVGCELARNAFKCYHSPTSPEDCGRCVLRKREAELIELGRGCGWFGVGLGTAALYNDSRLIWGTTGEMVEGRIARGFVDEVRLTTDLYLRHRAAIWSRQPVTRCVLSDKRPWANVSDPGTKHEKDWWSWHRLPTDIYRAMKTHDFDTEADALDALSRAACEVARCEVCRQKSVSSEAGA